MSWYTKQKWNYKDLQAWIKTDCDSEIGNKVVELDISENQILIFSIEICELTNLRYLNCSRNKMSTLPKEIGRLVNLKQFNCNNNQISILPIEFCNLINLQILRCSENTISVLPTGLDQLINLRGIYCNHNQISVLPIEILNYKKLTNFFYINNPIKYIMPQIKRFTQFNLNRQYNNSVQHYIIQQGITSCINYIMQSEPELSAAKLRTKIVSNMILSQKTKELLFECLEDDTIDPDLKITFEELLISVYDFVLKHEQKNNFFVILNNEITNGPCTCLAGRMSKLICWLNLILIKLEIYTFL